MMMKYVRGNSGRFTHDNEFSTEYNGIALPSYDAIGHISIRSEMTKMKAFWYLEVCLVPYRMRLNSKPYALPELKWKPYNNTPNAMEEVKPNNKVPTEINIIETNENYLFFQRSIQQLDSQHKHETENV